jgi:hypothetical protein
MLVVTWLTVALGLSALLSVVALALCVRALLDTKRDLLYVRNAGIGNGRRAAARGEHAMAWIRLGQAGCGLTLTAMMLWFGWSRGFRLPLPGRWIAMALVVSAWDILVALAAVTAERVRRRVIDLGIAEEGARRGDPRATRHRP